MMTDPLIDQLVGNLKPQRPLANIKLWMHCTACLVIIAGVILAIMGLRADYRAALQNGALLWKPGLFLAAWIGSVFLITDLSRPMGKIRKWHVAPLVLAGGILLWQFVVQLAHFSAKEMIASLNDPGAIYCLSVIIGGGGMIMFVVWKVWFSKTASPHPAVLGALAGFSAGCLAATAYALHCNKDSALYVSIYYWMPVLALSLLGSTLGRKLLKW
jgi:hypothetical protein